MHHVFGQKKAVSGNARAAGYSLIESAIVILVVGLLTAGFFSAYRVYLKTQEYQTTVANTDTVTIALNNFLIQNGRYPCPARLNAGRTDADYGIETQCDPNQGDYVTIAQGTCSNGICMEKGQQQTAFSGIGYMCGKINEGGTLNITAPAGKVFVSVPFVTYGKPTGTASADCSTFTLAVNTSCNAPTSQSVADAMVAAHPSTINTVIDGSAFGGNPCPGMNKLGYRVEYADPAGGTVAVNVRRGAVPFRTLGLDEAYSTDGYGSRLEYAVTEPLAVTVDSSGGGYQYAQDKGGITLEDGQTPPRTLAQFDHYIVFSPGPDRAGGYNAFGKEGIACPTVGLDAENCNTTTDMNALYRMAEYSTATGANHFDDYLKFYSATETPLWKIADTGGFNIRDLVSASSTGTAVGIGTTAPATGTTVEVAGTIHASGKSYADQLCDSGSGNCMRVQDIGGDTGAFKCPPTSAPGDVYASGVSGNQMNCTSSLTMGCPANELMTGMNADGTYQCKSFVGCSFKQRNMCKKSDGTYMYTFNLTAANQGTVRTSPIVGVSRQEKWTCNNSGNWYMSSQTGVCTCTAVDEHTQNACNNERSGNWTGYYYYHHVHQCPADTDTYTPDTPANDCVCSPATITRTQTCPGGTSGTWVQKNDWVCDSSSAGHYAGWVDQTNTCTCTATSQTRDLTCPTAYTGTWKQKRDYTCTGGPSAPGTWGAWVDTTNTCTCTGGTDTQTIGCTSPKVGSQTQERVYDCSSNAWGPWTTTVDNCTTPLYYWRPKTSGTPSGTKTGAHAVGDICSTLGDTSTCWSAQEGGGGYYNYASCQCE